MRGCVIRRAPLRSAWGRCAFGLRPHPRLTGLKLNRIFTLDVLLEKEPKKELGAVLRTFTLPTVEIFIF